MKCGSRYCGCYRVVENGTNRLRRGGRFFSARAAEDEGRSGAGVRAVGKCNGSRGVFGKYVDGRINQIMVIDRSRRPFRCGMRVVDLLFSIRAGGVGLGGLRNKAKDSGREGGQPLLLRRSRRRGEEYGRQRVKPSRRWDGRCHWSVPPLLVPLAVH